MKFFFFHLMPYLHLDPELRSQYELGLDGASQQRL